MNTSDQIRSGMRRDETRRKVVDQVKGTSKKRDF